jgi:hypothetical protein
MSNVVYINGCAPANELATAALVQLQHHCELLGSVAGDVWNRGMKWADADLVKIGTHVHSVQVALSELQEAGFYSPYAGDFE